MLLKSLKQSIDQIIAIVDQLQSLNEIKQQYLYCELHIGKHIRHINDHFLALIHGINIGVIDYNRRNRGTAIETKIDVALSELQQLIIWLENYENTTDHEQRHKSIKIFSEIDCLHTINQEFDSTVARELLYLINHTIHHAAHIGLIAKNQGIEIPLNTGMAPCTMTFLRANNS
jgi:uncharacterized damage-inducible protein DinB